MNGGSSLSRLLIQRGLVAERPPRSRLTKKKILGWAKAYHDRTGKWPSTTSGPIEGPDGEIWRSINRALEKGTRGMPPGGSLRKLLVGRFHPEDTEFYQRPRVRPIKEPLRPLTEEQVLAWADAHHERTGEWPSLTSGRIKGTKGENWRAINQVLYLGYRGLAGGSSVARLLDKHGRKPNPKAKPYLTERQIVEWIRAHYKRTGKWPVAVSGRIEGTDGETWLGVNQALYTGFRGLPGGSSLYKLRVRRFGAAARARGGRRAKTHGPKKRRR
jgi:hypothetical protein